MPQFDLANANISSGGITKIKTELVLFLLFMTQAIQI
jgi:hypothetical protein